ncbi:MAG: lytic transglycosylase domain-containing protein [Chitinophagaceae bacterium]|nr:lytic transglycosylase domain-containing protein [Chitinophagaceae bacterium]
MKKFSFFSAALSLFTLAVNPNSAIATTKDSVVIIKITDRNQLPKHLKVVKEEEKNTPTNTGVDSSRFVKRKIKDLSDKPVSGPNIQVNKSVYGTFTDYIIDYVKNYHKNHGDRIARIHTRNKGHFKLIDNIMKRFGVPREMKSLAIIESAMNCNAVSPVGAVGPWQFMEGTAKMLGLRVDQSIDERRDFYKSTNAAARYLRQLHSMFHDWLLVIAAYNSGPAPVLRAINSGMGRSFWDIKKRLPHETQNHVMAFIATTTILDRHSNVLSMGNVPKDAKAPKADFSSLRGTYNSKAIQDDADVDDVEEQKPQFSKQELDQMAILKVKGRYTIAAIARILDEDVVRLNRWNPDFDKLVQGSTIPVQLRIPIEKLEKFIISKEEIVQASSQNGK